MSSSPHKNVSNRSLSSPNQSPHKQSPASHSPFNFINQTTQNATSINPSFNNINQLQNNFRFQSLDLYRNPMIESIDGDFPQMIESQTIHQLKINQPSFSSPYLNQYQTDESIQTFEHLHPQNHVFSNPQPSYPSQKLINPFSKDKLSTPPSSQKLSQPLIKTEQNLLEDHDYNHWVFQEQSTQKELGSRPKSSENQILEQSQNLPLFSKKNIFSRQTFNQQLDQYKNTDEVSNNQSKGLHINQPRENEKTSEVKYRLDQLMSKFPIQSFQTGKKDGNFIKKKQIYDNSAPQLQMKRTTSINDGEQSKFKSILKSHEEEKRNPHTEGKILIMEQTQEPHTKFSSEEMLPKNSESKGGAFSLNYSESGYHSGAEINIPKPEIDSLYQQIHEQEESIQTYKQIIARLENQNIHLVNIIENFHQPLHQHPIFHDNLNFKEESLTYPNDFLNPQKSNFFDQPRSGGKGSRLSDSFHKFEKQESNGSRLHASHSQNLEIQSNHNKPPKMKSSSKISPNLEHQVEILESEKSELLKKIDWLNSVVEEMMDMGNRIKTQKSVILDNVQRSEYRNSKRSRQFSGDIGKVSQVIQTSFVNSPLFEVQNPNYKELYEREIEYQQHMKEEIDELSQLQDAYAVQFQNILKQIREIKKNRAYFQELKKEIQKSREKSLKKKEVEKRQRSPVIHYQNSSSPRRVFENQVIYQLKSQNEYLLNKYLKLKQLYSKEKTVQNHLDLTNNQMKKSFQTVHLEESISESKAENVFAHHNLNKRQKILERDSKNSYFNLGRERPASYGNFNIPITNRTQESRTKLFERRKNGSISCLSQVQETAKSRKNLTSQNNKESYRPGQVRNFSQNSDRQIYHQIHQRQNFDQIQKKHVFTENQTFSRIVERSLEQKIMEESKQRSSNCTHQTSQNMIGRYNNFIKNMKKRFGINSSIIGKEIPTLEDKPNQ